MEITRDKYELPVAVADSAKELAEITGAKKRSIERSAWDYHAGRTKYPTYIYIEVEEQES